MVSQQLLLIGSLLSLAFATPIEHTTSPNLVRSTDTTNGAGNYDNANYYDGSGGSDTYKCYYGGWENFPPKSKWIDFDDMWNYAESAMNGCDTSDQIGQMWNAVQGNISQASLVDHRFILAVIMQESSGCVNVATTSNPDGINNPGLMQSEGGVSFVGNSASSAAQQLSINQMVIDGTQGTKYGNGLVQCINQYPNIYEAARCYNSGSDAVDSTNLNYAKYGTPSYVNDIANRMTGWLWTQNKFDAGLC